MVAAFHRKLVFLDGVGDRFGEIGEEFFEPLRLGFCRARIGMRFLCASIASALSLMASIMTWRRAFSALCSRSSSASAVFTATLGLLKAANTPLMVKSDMDGRFASIASRFRARRM